ncbi:hypothetical protein H4R33_005414 [Dimargaris cristalligena]|uniref:Signal peptidase complex subunit 2 n=1 Tax=Dimargaris cristalligena TaxID=215637 RepID=A0A4P9ZV69_9FUNG|nr:hypothetical protein H4R33_005414 [Dimargaris cristalligena]RKP37463.1 signal peptidase complex subunit 2 [Dimargaris cristalligena]|eukprot:RKP37463.1 signal peptidase complex subunit 2 [Dimargaris cristalligena]
MSDTKVEQVTDEVPVTATKYNLNEMKIVCDEALQKFFVDKRGYKQYHTHTDVKLILGYSACLLAAFDFGYTWKKPFEEVRYTTFICTIGFVILSVLASAYAYLVQKNTIFVGSKSIDGKDVVLSVASEAQPNTGEYKLNFSVRPLKGDEGSATANVTTQSMSKSVGNWFYESGKLERAAIEKDLGEFLDTMENKKTD